jgi:hypothetical protein
MTLFRTKMDASKTVTLMKKFDERYDLNRRMYIIDKNDAGQFVIRVHLNDGTFEKYL